MIALHLFALLVFAAAAACICRGAILFYRILDAQHADRIRATWREDCQ